MVEPRIRDSGLTRSSSNVNYNLSTTAGNLWHYYAYSYCNRICLDTMSTQTLLWAVIWAICTEIDRCPDVISTSAVWSLIKVSMVFPDDQSAWRIIQSAPSTLFVVLHHTVTLVGHGK